MPHVTRLLECPALSHCSTLKSVWKINPFHQLFPTAQCASQQVDTVTASQQTNPASTSKNKNDGAKYKLPGFSAKSNTSSPQENDVLGYEINQWLSKETGMDRLKLAYTMRDGNFVEADTHFVNTGFGLTIPLSLLYSIYKHSTSEAEKKMENRKFLRGQAVLGGKFGDESYLRKQAWKRILAQSTRLIGASAIIFHLSHAMAVYENETTVEGIAVSTVLAFGNYGLGKDRRGFLKCIALGAIVGVIGGYIVYSELVSAGLTQEERHKERVRKMILERRSAKVGTTENIT